MAVAVLTSAGVVVAGRAFAVAALTARATVRAVRARALLALVVVALVLTVDMSVVQVVHMVIVDHRSVAARRAMGVIVRFGLSVCGHGVSLECSIASPTMWLTCSSAIA